MSVFGGDSWAREAQQRKRRVDDLLHDGIDSSSFKRLSNGKLTCLVCRNRPVFDSSLMLSMHSKGARHRAELSRLKQKELAMRDEVNKRIALSNDLISMEGPSSSSTLSTCLAKPLVEQARTAASEILSTKYVPKNSQNEKAEAKAGHDLPCAQGTNHLEHKLFPDPGVRLRPHGTLWIFMSAERRSLGLLLLVGSEMVMGDGIGMKMLNLILTRKIQTSSLIERNIRNASGHLSLDWALGCLRPITSDSHFMSELEALEKPSWAAVLFTQAKRWQFSW